MPVGSPQPQYQRRISECRNLCPDKEFSKAVSPVPLSAFGDAEVCRFSVSVGNFGKRQIIMPVPDGYFRVLVAVGSGRVENVKDTDGASSALCRREPEARLLRLPVPDSAAFRNRFRRRVKCDSGGVDPVSDLSHCPCRGGRYRSHRLLEASHRILPRLDRS